MIGLVIFVVALSSVGAVAGGPSSPTAPPVPAQTSVQAAAPSHSPASRRQVRKTPASFTPEMPLSEAIDILRNATTPPLNIVVYWKDLRESAEIYRDTPIGIDGLRGLRLRQSLEILLNSLSATSPAPIGYTVRHGVIVIATADALPASRNTPRVYDVSDLVMPPARWTFSPMFYTMLYNPLRRPLGTLPGRGNNASSTLRR
ncbi:MAG: hypothetical protein JSW27_05595 [Phycisphaerales bacterium]|nr:MAG: hypothetical protein JSW27_05595 [Phycisphaerales bacterium]